MSFSQKFSEALLGTASTSYRCLNRSALLMRFSYGNLREIVVSLPEAVIDFRLAVSGKKEEGGPNTDNREFVRGYLSVDSGWAFTCRCKYMFSGP